MPITYPEAKDFVAALKQPLDHPSVARLFADLGLSWTQAVPLSQGLDHYDLSRPDLGIALAFDGAHAVFEDTPRNPDGGPFVLLNCGFWGFEKEYVAYPGPLWSGIEFSDSLEQVKAKLGEPTRINNRRGIVIVYRWEFEAFTLSIQWADAARIRVVSYWMKDVR
ncbi:MAG: hypothetical protein ACREP7_05520 [Lysobacter sp.]